MGVYTEAFLEAFKPKSLLSVSEWADQNRVLTSTTSSVTGPWRTSFTPYLKEPMDICSEAEYQHIVLMFASQTAKSECLNNICGYFMDQDPSPQMMVQPNDKVTKEYSQIRISPMIKASPVLSKKVMDSVEEGKRKTDRDQPSMFYKPYPGGYLVLASANSAPSMASKPIRVLLRDEIDRFKDIPSEGSPMELSEQRTAAFFNKLIVDSSTPLKKGESRIEEVYERSDKRNYFIPCPHCEEMQTIEFEMVQWDKEGSDTDRSKSAKILCKHCNEIMKGSGRADSEWLARGEWRKTAESGIAGFYINSLYSPLTTLQEIVYKWLVAVHSRDEEKKQTFYNLQLGLPYEDKREAVDYETIEKNRRTTYDAELHDNILCLTAAVDTQDTWLEAEIRGWSHGNETYGVEHKIFAGDPAQPKVWEELDAWLNTPRYFKDGNSLLPMVTCVDSGGHYTTEVYKFCKAREARNVFAIKGASTKDKALITQPSKVGVAKDTILWLIGTEAGKAKVMSALKNESHGFGYCHFPREANKGYDEEYFKGLMAEKLIFNVSKKMYEWKKVYERNEPLDIFVYNFAALEILKPSYEELERRKQAGNVKAVVPQQPKRNLSRGIQY
jgi:phage terminase large subunit GpA-like protein